MYQPHYKSLDMIYFPAQPVFMNTIKLDEPYKQHYEKELDGYFDLHHFKPWGR